MRTPSLPLFNPKKQTTTTKETKKPQQKQNKNTNPKNLEEKKINKSIFNKFN